MKFAKRLLCLLLCLGCLCTVLPVGAGAQEDVTPYIQRAIQYYLHYQKDAQTEIDSMLDQITAIDPGKGVLWRDILESWAYNNEQLPISRDVLPDGLPQDDSLCIVVLGFGLNSDGSMKEELIDRLVVALASALKYPNAYICVTGGPTGGNATEGGQMAAWLMEKGVDAGRIITETKSLSTHENALNVYEILVEQYPQVSALAVVSSDYHISWGVSMFEVLSLYRGYHGGKTMQVVGNAANTTGSGTDTLYSQAWGISVITGTPFSSGGVPATYAQQPQETQPVQTEPAPNSEVHFEEEDHSWMVFSSAMVAVAIGIALIPTGKKKKKL